MAQRLGTIDDVRMLAPSVKCKIDSDPSFRALVEEFLDIYSESFDPAQWCKKTSAGHVYLALHFLTVHGHIEDPGEGLEAQSESFGQMSVSYRQATTASDPNGFDTTSFGKKYLDLRSRVNGFFVIGATPIDGRYHDY